MVQRQEKKDLRPSLYHSTRHEGEIVKIKITVDDRYPTYMEWERGDEYEVPSKIVKKWREATRTYNQAEDDLKDAIREQQRARGWDV
jgi:hypothetical protein